VNPPVGRLNYSVRRTGGSIIPLNLITGET